MSNSPERGEAIVLIGFMGSGKSSVGRALTARTGLPLHDTDRIVSTRFGLPIPAIFQTHGEEKFRACEAAVLAEFSRSAAVIVTGGGIILAEANRSMLRRLGCVVNLTADEETLFARVSRRSTRPLLQTENPRQTLRELLRARDSIYREVADLTVDTSQLTHEEVVDAVLSGIDPLQRHGS